MQIYCEPALTVCVRLCCNLLLRTSFINVLGKLRHAVQHPLGSSFSLSCLGFTTKYLESWSVWHYVNTDRCFSLLRVPHVPSDCSGQGHLSNGSVHITGGDTYNGTGYVQGTRGVRVFGDNSTVAAGNWWNTGNWSLLMNITTTRW